MTRFTHRGFGNHALIKTIFACQYTDRLRNSHEAAFKTSSAGQQLVRGHRLVERTEDRGREGVALRALPRRMHAWTLQDGPPTS